MPALAETFEQIIESLPDDWTDLELDLRIRDVERYVEAATYVVTCNAQPYSKNEWHWRVMVAHRFGHAAAAPAGLATMKMLPAAGHQGGGARRGEPPAGGRGGELGWGDPRRGRARVEPLWGRPESMRRERRRLLSQ